MLRSLSDDLLVVAAAGPVSGLWWAGRAGVRELRGVDAGCGAGPTGAGGHVVGGRVRVRGRRSGARCARQVPQRTGRGSLAGRAARAVLCERTVPVRRRHVGPGERGTGDVARGVDHGALLARAVATELDVGPERLLVRDDGPPQTGRAAARASGRPGPARARDRSPGRAGARRRRCRDHGRNAGCSGASILPRAGRVRRARRPRSRARRVRRSALGTLPILRTASTQPSGRSRG